MTEAFKSFLANPWVALLGSIPLLMTLCLLGALQTLDDARNVVWIHRLWRISWVLLPVFGVLVAARFILLSR